MWSILPLEHRPWPSQGCCWARRARPGWWAVRPLWGPDLASEQQPSTSWVLRPCYYWFFFFSSGSGSPHKSLALNIIKYSGSIPFSTFPKNVIFIKCVCLNQVHILWLIDMTKAFINLPFPSIRAPFFFFFLLMCLLKKLGHWSHGVSWSLDFADCIPGVFNWFLCSAHFLMTLHGKFSRTALVWLQPPDRCL